MTTSLPVPSKNTEKLSQLYDPSYVHRVDTLADSAPVQVCLESRMLRDAAGTGVATYARVLARCLASAGAVPALLDDGAGRGGSGRSRPARWLSAARRSPRAAIAQSLSVDGDPSAWTVPDVFREAQVFFNIHGRLLPVAFARPPEVMHWTYPVPLFVVGAKNLYTIHDLIPLTHPELTPIPTARHRRLLCRIVEKAHGLVTVSETMRELVIAELGVLPSLVVNSFQAVEAPLQADPLLPHDLRSGRYFLYCGRVEPRKNLERLAIAHRQSRSDLPLVVVGPVTAGEGALEDILKTFPKVRRLPWVPRNELVGLMRRARALLFPSLAEGFGLPIAEAMTLGCPVLTSDHGATAEIAGDAALLVAPESIDDIARAITMLGTDDALCGHLRALGFARGRLFAPEAYARRLRALYAGALAAPAADTGRP